MDEVRSGDAQAGVGMSDLTADTITAAIKDENTNIMIVTESDGDVQLMLFCHLSREGLQALLMVAYKMVHEGKQETVN